MQADYDSLLLTDGDHLTDSRVARSMKFLSEKNLATLVFSKCNGEGVFSKAHLPDVNCRWDIGVGKLAFLTPVELLAGYARYDEWHLQIRRLKIAVIIAFERFRNLFGTNNYKISELKIARRLIEKKIESFILKRHFRFRLQTVSLWRKKKNELCDISIIHAHDLYTLPAGVWLKRKTGARLIYDAHEYEPGRYNFSETQRAGFKALEDRCFADVDRIVTVSESIAGLYAERFHGPKPTVIFNTPTMGEPAGFVDIKPACGLPETAKVLAYTGRVLGEGRGLDVVLESLVTLGDVHLAVLGQRVERYDRWLMDQAHQLGVEARVHLLPPVPPDQVVHSLRSADIGLCLIQDMALSYRYCMPNKLFEATFAGIPLIVSNLPDLAAFVREIGHGEVVDQTSPQEIASAVQKILEQPENYRPDENAKRLLAQKYSWQAQAKKLTDLYAELLET